MWGTVAATGHHSMETTTCFNDLQCMSMAAVGHSRGKKAEDFLKPPGLWLKAMAGATDERKVDFKVDL